MDVHFGTCSCERGRILLDAQTHKEVGREVFFYDEDAGAYSLNGRLLTRAELAGVDWSTPRFRIPASYIGPDGKIHGTEAYLEYCDRCEAARRSRHDVTFRWTITSPSGRRRYQFTIEPHAPNTYKRAFHAFVHKCYPRTPRERQEHMLASFLVFGPYSPIGHTSERDLAKRFKVSRGRLRSIRARYLRRMGDMAVRQ